MNSEIVSTLYALAADPDWSTVVGAPIYNWDFKETITVYPFLKYKIVFSNGFKPDYTNKEIQGFIAIGIFTKSGTGQLQESLLADRLDDIFQDKLLPNIQLGSSFLQDRGIDQYDKTLKRTDYMVPFTYFGER